MDRKRGKKREEKKESKIEKIHHKIIGYSELYGEN